MATPFINADSMSDAQIAQQIPVGSPPDPSSSNPIQALASGFNVGMSVDRLGGPTEALRSALWQRDQQVTKTLGQPLAFQANGRLFQGLGVGGASDYLLTGTNNPVSTAYEEALTEAKANNPALASVPTFDQVRSGVAQKLTGIASQAQADAQTQPIWSAIGRVGAAVLDPLNLAIAGATGPLGEVADGGLAAKALWGGVKQAGIWAAATAAEIPARRQEAQAVGLPGYTNADAVRDVEGAAAGAFVLHNLFTVGGAGLRTVLGRGAPGAAPGVDPSPGAAPPPPGGDNGGPSGFGGGEYTDPRGTAWEDIYNSMRGSKRSGPAGGFAGYGPDDAAAGGNSAPPPPFPPGNFPINQAGHVLDEAGGIMRFNSQKEAARWIIDQGHGGDNNQIFQPANHPEGTGFSAQQIGVRELDPEVRGAGYEADEAGRNDLAVGALRGGEEHARAIAALTKDEPPPAIEPQIDQSQLFAPETWAAPSSVPALLDAGVSPTDPAAASLLAKLNYQGRDMYAAQFDPRDLQAAPDLFQYKGGGDQSGVTDRLRGVETWDPSSSGKSIVWQGTDGQLYIADGHQRLGLAMRLLDQNPVLDGLLYREADGWSSQDVRTLAALKNIREGSGTPLDAAKVFRDNPGTAIDSSLPVSGNFIHQAKGLAKLSENAFSAVVNKVVPENYAALIGHMAGDRPDLHDGMISLLHQADPSNIDEAQSLIHESLEDDWMKAEGQTADLFGAAPDQSLMIHRVKIRSAVLKELRKDARLFSTLTARADAIEAGGNTLARNANETALGISRAAESVVSKLSYRDGEVGAAMKAAAEKVANGARVGDVAPKVAEAVREAVRAAQEADADRAALINPPALAAEDIKTADLFDEPGGKGSRAQLSPKPEDAELESQIEKPQSTTDAIESLNRCAPEL